MTGIMEAQNDTGGLPKLKIEDQDISMVSIEHSDESEAHSGDLARSASSDPSSLESFFGDFRAEQRMSDVFTTWTAQDEHFAQLFKAWDNLPLGSRASCHQNLVVLRDLEDVIVPFEKAISYSDEGFAAWRLRHQAAMENGLSPDATWPKLRNNNQEWVNEKWAERYHHLVKERERLIRWRFDSLGRGTFSRGPPTPLPGRLAIKKMHHNRSAPETLPQDWHQLLDELLSAEAERQGVMPQFVLDRFWTPPAPVEIHDDEPALTNMSSDSELPSPPSVPSTGCFSQSRASCAPPTRNTGGKFKLAHMGIIEIESDSE